MSARLDRLAFDSPEYKKAFGTFLKSTDQKKKAIAWLRGQLASMPEREVFLDVGAGSGVITGALAEMFRTTIALEPNRDLRRELERNCPNASVLRETIGGAPLGPAIADFVLCCHVFYYIDRADRLPILRRLLGWVRPGGMLVVVLQSPRSQCSNFLRSFGGSPEDVSELRDSLRREAEINFESTLTTRESHIDAASFEDACAIAQVVLSYGIPDHLEMPTLDELRTLLDENFRQPGGGYRISCNQDFLCLRPR
ncbi:class I SAM-dependent methyltransferase [Kolteria novifilia]